ncbi:MAG: metallophosphoesterase family protein [Pseudomonadota bacterium]
MHRDLGALADPVLLFGGPYSNVQATEALFAAARDHGIGPDHQICTGDVVAYCAAPRETVQLVRDAGCTVVAGNCERQLAVGADTCGCGFEEGSACDLLSVGWYPFANAEVQQHDRRWMAKCPDIVSFHHHGARYAVIHGGISDVARFLWPTSETEAFLAEWAMIEALIGKVDHVIAGHCGLPFLRETPRGRWINAGVIGMPPHDGNEATRYAILERGKVSFHNLSYDVDAAIDAMHRNGLTQGYHHALRSGYWPSEDVLPEALRSSSLARG